MPAVFGRYLAEHIPDATLVELGGGGHLYWVGNPEATLNEIEQFVTGRRAQPSVERVLATVLRAGLHAGEPLSNCTRGVSRRRGFENSSGAAVT